MSNITFTTKTIESSYGTFEQEAWEIYGYHLLRTIKINDPEEPADWRVRTPNGAPTLDNMNYLTRDGVDYGVNWSAMGTRTTADARTYGMQLLHAAEAAEAFTKIRNDYPA